MWCLRASLSESSPWHDHDVYEFVTVMTAGGTLSTRERDVRLGAGDTLLLPPGVEHRFFVSPGEDIDIRLVCFTPSEASAYLAPQLVGRLTSAGDRLTRAGHTDESAVFELAMTIHEGLDFAAALSDWAKLGLLLAQHIERSALPPCGAYDARIATIVAWIDEHLDEAMTLASVSSHFGMSRSLLTREFRRYTGTSFVAYCNRRRLERAAGLMASGSASVAEAAFSAGFSNLSHFHRQFKTAYGMTPAAFSRKIRDDGGLNG
ncbi:AraC family transcriptional regulator, mar-sox-rob regulon activator [Tropicimonas isoalkanivorans]|uniref:AraC family transcriptional regulator, mar-sox-rob regulon activator n=2 Tax=Tropicimonas isoalkanivorans TaxID=441112 RepID=A0A1I1DNM5_9RHOB|nr:AraC family transcriptional regulator [Tropicimonas isoalkanivorans]SFB74270.1 AraC family transcriptional regulator, mar-sox-rob regulon activator [Tropicimonas isoalkanivorans]